ncbi:TPA: phage late control D family protein [Enterobacter cancerogenus]|nr:phage late control D family protein [Enterobacter cancerogenus]HDR2163655.1 phage late control D family protein [Enterobacter cancerogenus]HDR2266793.1 phage late control D family protein [Enterobacter cancerogenus]
MITEMNIRAGGKMAPDFMLLLGNRDITHNFSSRLIDLSLTDNRGQDADELKITLDDSQGLIDLPERGMSLSLWLGWQGAALEYKGSYTIDSIQFTGAPDRLTIQGRSADFRGSLNSRREQSWHDTTIGEIVQTIAARNALSASVAADLSSIAVEHIDQTQESDAVFLTRLAERNGAFASIKEGNVLFMKAGSALTASGTPVPLMVIERGDGDNHTFSISDRTAHTGVTAKWLQTSDPKKQNPKLTLNRQPALPAPGASPHPNAASTSGATNTAQQPQEKLAGEAGNVLELPTVYASEAQALRAAEAKWRALQRDVVTFSIKLAIGRADLFPETPVRVKGFKPVIDEQPWIINRVVHNLNGKGFTTQLHLELDIKDENFTQESD